MKYAKWKNCQSRSRTRSTTFGQRRTDNQMKGHKRICKLDQMSSFHLSLLPFYYVIQELSENWSANYILSWPWCILCNFCNHVLGMRLMFSDSVLPPSNELFDILFIHGSMAIFFLVDASIRLPCANIKLLTQFGTFAKTATVIKKFHYCLLAIKMYTKYTLHILFIRENFSSKRCHCRSSLLPLPCKNAYKHMM